MHSNDFEDNAYAVAMLGRVMASLKPGEAVPWVGVCAKIKEDCGAVFHPRRLSTEYACYKAKEATRERAKAVRDAADAIDLEAAARRDAK